MDIKIWKIEKRDLENEVVWLSVLKDTDIGRFMIMDTTYTNSGSISNKWKHIYWFPDQTVKKGDYVILHTKIGSYYKTANKGSTENHHFFWNMKVQVWNNSGDAAVLIHTPDWEITKVP